MESYYKFLERIRAVAHYLPGGARLSNEMPAKPIRTILLVEDHEIILKTLHNYLEKKGFNVLEARNGEEALLIAECHPGMIHVLVTDLIMARMNGRELVQKLLPLRPEMQVVMMSGYPEEIVTQERITPLVPIMRKPFLPKHLLSVIEQALANPQSTRTLSSLVQPPPDDSQAKSSGM